MRGQINVFLFRGIINRFVERVYGVRVNNIRFVRQVSMNRMICVVNGRYHVKIFRDVSVMRLKDYKFLLDFIRPYLNIKIPGIFVHDKIPMYVADKLRLDDNFDVVSIVDWDSLSIVDSPNIDKDSFEKLWNIYKNSK